MPNSKIQNEDPSYEIEIGNDEMKNTVEVIVLVHEHTHSHILLLKHAESYYMLQGGSLKPGETEIEDLKRKLTSNSTPEFKIQLKAKLTLSKIDTADLVHEETHPHLLLLKIAGSSYFMLPEIENLKRRLTSMLGPTKPKFMPNWQGNQSSQVTIILTIKDVFSMIQHVSSLSDQLV